jgi:hypothetical protein
MISATSGSKLYIAGVHAAATDTSAEYGALTWVEVKNISNLGDFGDEASQITVDHVGEGRTLKLKGTRNAGEMAVTCSWDALDPGQIAVRAAEKTSFAYDFKLEANDKADDNDTNSIFYFAALVRSARRSQGGPNDVVTMAMTLDITTEIVEVPATVVANT